MRKIVVTEFISLDGVFEAPGDDGSDYKYKGWTSPYGGEEFQKFKTEELDETDILLLGRITYDAFAIAWPKMEDTAGDFGKKFNSMPKYVVSNTLKEANWKNSHRYLALKSFFNFNHITIKEIVNEVIKIKYIFTSF